MNTTLTVEEYAKYVVTNIGRAQLPNAYKIAENFEGPGCFDFEMFLKYMVPYIEDLIKENRLDINKCYAMLVLINTTLTKYKSPFKYNKTFLVDDFIMDLWRIAGGH